VRRTGWLEAALYTEITLLHGSIVTELGYMIRAGREAVLATVALIPIDHYNAVLGPLANSTSRAYFLTSRLATVHAGQGEKCPGYIGELAFPDFNGPPPFWTRLNVIGTLTCYFTGATLDTSVGIKVKTILFRHYVYRPFIDCNRYFLVPNPQLYAFRTSTRVCLGIAVTIGSKALSGSVLYMIFTFAPPSSIG